MKTPLSLELEFARAEQADDPFAFQFVSQQYLLRREGGRFETARLDWSPELLADLQAVRLAGHDPAITQRLGGLLRRFLQSTDWSVQESQCSAALREKRNVIVTIRSAAAELYALPWELLTLRDSGQHLGELPGVLLRYEWPAMPAAPLADPSTQDPGRILFAWSAAAGAVPAAEQLAAIVDASQRGAIPFDRERDMLQHVSCAQLVAALESAQQAKQPIRVLHLLCHGAAIGQSFGLALDAESASEPVLVDAGRLRQLLAPYAGMLRLVVLSACDSGNVGPLGSQLGSIAQTLHRAGIAQVIASRHPLSVSGARRFTEAFYSELLGTPSSTEQAFLAARSRLALDAAQPDWASLQLYAHAAAGDDSRPLELRPYRGLLAFQPEHGRFFFGRDREVAEILGDARALIEKREPRLLAVDGASGSGKSSVVFAGALSGLLALLGSGAALLRMRPGSAPLAALDALLRTRRAAAPALLVIDQLEELFTQTPDGAQRRDFARRLYGLATSADSGVFVVLTLRSDFVGHCGELLLDEEGLRLDRVIYDEAHRVSIAQMNGQQLRDVIERPAHCVGLRLEPGLVERMLHDVDQEPGALPLLAYTLDLLWLRRAGALLTQAAYDQLGGVTGALHRRADQLIAALTPSEERQARRLLVRLGSGLSDGSQGVRLRVRVATRRPENPVEAAHFDRMLARLAEARLVVLDREGAEDTVEVAHEALLRKWPLLARWAQEDRQLNAELDTVETWVRLGRQHDTLLSAAQLDRAAEILARHPDALSQSAVELFEKSRAERARSEERDRFARDCLRMLAVKTLDGDPIRQAAILREAESQDPTAVPMWLPYAVDILQSGLLMQAELVGRRGAFVHGAVSPDGTRIATATADGAVCLFGLSGGAPSVLHEGGGAATWVDFSPDGQRLVVACADGAARVFSLADPRAPTILRGHAAALTCAAVSPDGQRIATAAADGSVRLWGTSGKPTGLSAHQRAVRSVAWSPDGSRLATASADETARVYPLDDPEDVEELEGHEAPLRSATFAATGKHLLTLGEDGTARLWDESGRARGLGGKGRAVSAAALSPDGKQAALGLESGSVLLQDLHGKGDATPLFSGEGEVTKLAFSPDGTWLVAAFEEEEPRVVRLGARGLEYGLEGHRGAVTHVMWSRDSRWLISLSTDGTGRVFDLTRPALYTPQAVGQDEHADAFLYALPPSQRGTTATVTAQSPDGKRIVIGQPDGRARVDGVDGGAPLWLEGHTDAVTLAAFSPDGRRILTMSSDGTTRLWGEGGRSDLLLAEGDEQGVGLSRDWRYFVTERKDKLRQTWELELDPKTLITRLWRATPYCLSVADRESHLRESHDQAVRSHAASLTKAAAHRPR